MVIHSAPKGEKVTFIHLFGIKYYNEIKKVGVRQVIEQSGIHSSYYIEVSKGVKLAKHVKIIQF
jgi:hypothetical protein